MGRFERVCVRTRMHAWMRPPNRPRYNNLDSEVVVSKTGKACRPDNQISWVNAAIAGATDTAWSDFPAFGTSACTADTCPGYCFGTHGPVNNDIKVVALAAPLFNDNSHRCSYDTAKCATPLLSPHVGLGSHDYSAAPGRACYDQVLPHCDLSHRGFRQCLHQG